MRDGCFNAAFWLFSFEYFCSAISIPYIFEQKEMPTHLTSTLRIVFWVVMAFNIFSPCLYAFWLGYGNIYSYKHGGDAEFPGWFDPTYLSTKYTIGFEQLVSGVLVIIAVICIRKFLIEHGM